MKKINKIFHGVRSSKKQGEIMEELNLQYADLHLHTTASDGTLTPRQMVKSAKSAGIATIAITDHDSINGIEEALKAGEELSIEVIPGVELSTFDGETEVHILGYFIDPANIRLKNILLKQIDARNTRAVGLVQKLKGLGFDFSLTRVHKILGSDFIDSEGGANEDRFKITPLQAIQLIMEAQGISVLAHPGKLSDGSTLGEEVIAHYVDLGLDGIEVYSSKHTVQQIDYYQKFALKYNLLITGGSDCHEPKDLLFKGDRLPYEYVKTLKKAFRDNLKKN